jgi:hypothetical protein
LVASWLTRVGPFHVLPESKVCHTCIAFRLEANVATVKCPGVEWSAASKGAPAIGNDSGTR